MLVYLALNQQGLMDPFMCYKTVRHVFLQVLCSERITCLCTISLLINSFFIGASWNLLKRSCIRGMMPLLCLCPSLLCSFISLFSFGFRSLYLSIFLLLCQTLPVHLLLPLSRCIDDFSSDQYLMRPNLTLLCLSEWNQRLICLAMLCWRSVLFLPQY